MNEIKCMVCDNKKLDIFLSLGPIPLVNNFLKEDNIHEIYYPLDVSFCNECNLVQLLYKVNPDIMFKDYLYFSSTSDSMKEHYKNLALSIAKNLLDNSLVVEIGSNDGILLQNLINKNLRILGVEPALNVAKVAIENGVNTLNKFFSEDTAKEILEMEGKAKVIIGTNVFAHTPNLKDLVKGIKLLLDKDGFAVFESPYLVDLLEKLEFDTIYHEHVSYLSVRPLKYLFEHFDLELFKIERTDVHGGSIRFYIKHKNEGGIDVSVNKFLNLEKKLKLDNIETYKEFTRKIQRLKIDLLSLLIGLKNEGYRIAAYGAAAKANVLLNYFNISKETIDYVVDRSKYKQELYTPGKRFKIYSPEKLLSDKPDYLLILAWNLAEEIINQQKAYKKLGGKFIIPIPTPRVIE